MDRTAVREGPRNKAKALHTTQKFSQAQCLRRFMGARNEPKMTPLMQARNSPEIAITRNIFLWQMPKAHWNWR